MPTNNTGTGPPTDRTIRTVPRGVDPAESLPKAAAVRIGPRDLWLSNRGGAQPHHLDTMDLAPEYVVTVNRQRTDATTDHHPLGDGVINDQAAFTRAVETARDRYQQDGTLLVHCAAGISRSTTVVATVLAVEENQSFSQTVQEVKQYRHRAHPHRKLQVNAQSYLATEHDRQTAWEALQALARTVTVHHADDETALAP